MKNIRLSFVHFIIFLFFIGFEETSLTMIRTSSNIIPALEEENNINSMLETKLNELWRRNCDVDIDSIQFQTKRIARRNGREPKIWDQWSNWSACSVTCGIGKIMRWRHCIGGSCSLGEKKAQLKTCTSAAC